VSKRQVRNLELFQSLSSDWRIEFKELLLDKVLGRGASGEVRLAYWRGTLVAAKVTPFTIQ